LKRSVRQCKQPHEQDSSQLDSDSVFLQVVVKHSREYLQMYEK
jgi:hypothetical protein